MHVDPLGSQVSLTPGLTVLCIFRLEFLGDAHPSKTLDRFLRYRAELEGKVGTATRSC